MFINHAVIGDATKARLNNAVWKPDERAFAMLLEMDSIPTEFYLTGSRFFTESTGYQGQDWDFFTQHTPKTEAWLIEHNFIKLDTPKYAIATKQEIAVVMQFPDPKDKPRSPGRTPIQVQLIQNVALKNKIQEAFMTSEYLKIWLTNKSVARSIWEAAFIGATLDKS